MYYSKKLCKHLKKSFSVFLAFAIMLSVCAVSGVSLSVSAATDSGSYYLITTANSEWQNKTVTYRIYDSSQHMLKSGSVLARNGGDTYVLPNSVLQSTNVAKLEFSLASFDLPTKAVANGYSRIFFNSKSVNSNGGGSYDYSNPYVHYYSGSTTSSTGPDWPGVKMTKVSSSSSVYYADIPQGYKKLNFCDWNEDGKYTVNQTTDQTIGYYGNYAYFSGNRWENPRIRSIDISNATSAQDSVYMDNDENLVLSKFSFDGSGVDKKPVYVYNDNWKNNSSIYATYSLVGAALSESDKTYAVTVELTSEDVNGYTMFKGLIPVDTNVCFHVNEDNLKGCSNVTTYAGGTSGSYSSTYDDNTATYKMQISTENWMKRSDVNTVNFDAVIENTFANNPNIVGVDATYFDYWSDYEQTNGYLTNEPYYDNKDGIENYWYQFDNFNEYISSIAKENQSSWKYPLYFGNMFFNDEWKGPFEKHAKALTNINNYNDPFYYAVNNSNGMISGGGNYYQSLQGLVYNKLDSNGDLQVVNGLKAPYFDANTLSTEKYNGKKVASVFKSSFPFRTETDSNGVTKYSFTSKDAKDNIYFTWDSTTPKLINYGSGTNYGVKDKLKTFGGGNDGYGIFPFNTNSNTKTQTIYKDNTDNGKAYVAYVDVDAKYDKIILRSGTDYNPRYPADQQGGIDISGNGGKEYAFDTDGNSVDVQVKASSAVPSNKKRIYLQIKDASIYNNWVNGKTVTAYCYVDKDKEQNTIWYNNDIVFNEVQKFVAPSGGTTYTRSGNDELDYGFGVRLDIDFRVPAEGKLSDNSPVTFNFTGDDDIWVYVGEDSTGANADLVLDLGGDHKETEGNINFATMAATAKDVFADYSTTSTNVPTVSSSWLCMQSDADQLYAYIWNSENTSIDAKYLLMDQETINGKKFYTIDLANYSDYNKVILKSTPEGNWTNQTNNLDISSYTGKVLQWENKSKYNPSEYSVSHSTNLGEVTTTFNNGKHLDPNKTYHMVVFYMERGESESNLSIDFTMTPANNALTVNKSLDTADTVTEIANDLRANETYDYTITDGTSASGKGYKLNGVDSTLGNNGSFVLKDKGNAEFENTFKTGSGISVNESISSPLSYTTSWELVNKKTASTITSATGTRSDFVLKDYDNESSNALLELDYLNTIKTSSISLSKSTVDQDGNPYATEQQFDFRLLIDLDGDGSKYSPKAYPVKYTLGENTYTATQDGIISVGAGETVQITGLPVGATYTLEEQTASGYVPVSITADGFSQNFDGTYSGTVNDGGNTLAVVNKLNPTNTDITVGKTLDGSSYTGSKFSYTLKGLPEMTTSNTDGEGNDINTVDTSQTNMTVSNVLDGNVVFNNITFDKVGYYRYYIQESYNAKDTDEEKEIYNLDNRLFLVEISVTANESNLVVSKSTFSIVNADKAQAFLNADVNSKDGYFTNDVTSAPIFENTTNKAKLTVNKGSQSKQNISGTTFALIKVSEANVFDSSDLSSVIADIGNYKSRATLGVTDDNGNVVFDKLLVYQNGSGYYTKENGSVVYKNSSDNNYVDGKYEKQVYCLFEYQPAAGYNPTGVIQYYTFPINDNGTYKFDVTASYVNGAVVMPNASGSGMNMFFVIGFIILGFGTTVVLSYIAYDNVQRKKRKVRHNIKK